MALHGKMRLWSLAEYADMRLDRVASWAKASLSDRAYEVFASIPASAGMVQCFEELMELNGQPAFNMMESGSFQEEISEDDLKSMQNDPRYVEIKIQHLSKRFVLVSLI